MSGRDEEGDKGRLGRGVGERERGVRDCRVAARIGCGWVDVENGDLCGDGGTGVGDADERSKGCCTIPREQKSRR